MKIILVNTLKAYKGELKVFNILPCISLYKEEDGWYIVGGWLMFGAYIMFDK